MLRIKFLGNGAWGNGFTKHPKNDANRQAVWMLVYDTSPRTNYTVALAAQTVDWDPPSLLNQASVPLRGNYSLLIVNANPTPRPVQPGPAPAPAPGPVVAPDVLTITVTNTDSGEADVDEPPIEVVDPLQIVLLKKLDLGETFFELFQEAGKAK